ncbi:hypothetical protein I4U23_005554 [Adineta vaga]|nr:hypothetical protein I4U23_005554 [Adineta vaga]
MCNRSKNTKEIHCRSWLKLLLSALVPLLIGVFTIITTIQQQKLSTLERKHDKQESLLLRQQSEHQADNLHKENIYATYLDDVSNLLILDKEKSLMQIFAKTLASLRQLDSERKKHLFMFLYDSKLINSPATRTNSSLLELKDADFNGIRFRGTTGASCSFKYLYLYNVYLSNASFINCYIDRSNFSFSTMYKTTFSEARLLRTSFKFAILDQSGFNQATFFQMIFIGASLVGCNFTNTIFSRHEHGVSYLINVNLTGVVISDQQLTRSILNNSVLPNGTWGPIDTNNLIVNGDAERNVFTPTNTDLTDWYPSTSGIIAFVAHKEDFPKEFGKYYFRVKSSYTLIRAVSMSQIISFENFTLLISSGKAHYQFSASILCMGNQYVDIELIFVDLNGLKYKPIYRKTRVTGEMKQITQADNMHVEIRSFQLKIGFVRTSANTSTNATDDETYCMADNIQFFIKKKQ